MTVQASTSRVGNGYAPGRLLTPFMPAVFVWLWSTGFIGAKYGLPYAEPFTLLLYRTLVTLMLLGLMAWWMKPQWPSARESGHVAITGLLVHGCYLGGVFYAIQDGMPAGLVSLIVGLQPLVTALAAVLVLGEGVRLRQWAGLLLGLVGVGLVLLEKMGLGPVETFSPWTLVWALIALLGISLGTVYQKRHCQQVALIPGAIIQYCATGCLFAMGGWWFESSEVDWNLQLVLAIGWLVLGLSVGAILLLMQLIRMGAASKVASLFYLVPPVTALEAYILFDERLGMLAMMGGGLSVLGVALVVMQKRGGIS
ncbi:DMT family transporter [Marinobacterium maritimum]|uniref:DMT family transporter n=1 Tax=Marinobacterium maritimum TaxID=500162 RepID=A0ABP3TE52_9GAMM